MALDVNLHQQIPVDAAAGAHAALAPDPDALSLVHTGGDFHFLAHRPADLALALAGGAGGLDDLAPAAAAGTHGAGLHLHTHEILNRADLAGALALLAGLDDPVGGAGALTGGAVFDALGGDLLLTAEGGLLEGQLQLGQHIFAPAGGVLPGALTAAAAEELSEDVPQVPEIPKAAEAPAVTAAAGGEVGVYSGKAELVVLGLLVRVGEDLVGLADLLELFLGFLIAGVAVRMVLHRTLAVGLFDILGAGVLADAQHLIVIAFILSHVLTSIRKIHQ